MNLSFQSSECSGEDHGRDDPISGGTNDDAKGADLHFSGTSRKIPPSREIASVVRILLDP